MVFDVNETLLDLSSLREHFEAVFGARAPLGEWFARLLHGSLVANELGLYRPFDRIGVEALLGMALGAGIELAEEDAEAVVGRLAHLPPHPDAIPGLETLIEAGYRTAALTNGSPATAQGQIDNAGLGRLVPRVISVDAVRRFKPDPAPYQHAAGELGVAIEELLLVAAHDWDVAGAIRAGASGAHVRRDPARWSLEIEPDLVVDDLRHLARALDRGIE